MGVENTSLEKRRLPSVEQHGGCKKGFAIRCYKYHCEKGLTRCKVTFFLVTGRAGRHSGPPFLCCSESSQVYSTSLVEEIHPDDSESHRKGRSEMPFTWF
ncbi:hypothetical protein TNCV_1252741 [Trichonephila clavipes]|nr:hypothetical protein TNCV_1252741 [Trichonephila clavipes]